MTKINKTITGLVLFLFLYLATGQIHATRYDLIEIDEPQVNAINNIGTLVGIDANGTPYIWRRNQDDMNYPDETNVSLERRLYRLPLPIDFASNISNIQALSIGEEVLDNDNDLVIGEGGSVVGSYTDENGRQQSVVWYQAKIEENFAYKALTLPPHRQFAAYCSGKKDEDFTHTECLYPEDRNLVHLASFCQANKNWEMPNRIIVDQNFDFLDETATPDCTPSEENTLPICEYKMEKIPDGTETVTVETGEITRPKFKYLFNKNYRSNTGEDFEASTCMLAEHAELMLLAMALPTECNNNNYTKLGDPLLVQCDPSSKAIAINANNTITGTSFKPDGGNRPVVWFKRATDVKGSKPDYTSADLGLLRQTSKADNSITGSSDNGEININVTRTYRNGYPTAIDRNGDRVIGMLRLDDPESPPLPVVWNDITNTNIEDPIQLSAPATMNINTDACSASTSKTFPSTVEPLSLSTNRIVGWYEDASSNPRPVYWTQCSTPRNTPKKFAATHLLSLDKDNIGKGLHNNKGEIIGTNQVNTENTSVTKKSHAFYQNSRCGIEDLNNLLATKPPEGFLLEEAYYIAPGASSSPILARGKAFLNGTSKSYVLTAKETFVDLEVIMQSSQNSFRVGEQQTIRFIVKNNAIANNVDNTPTATCIFFRITNTVYEGETYEDKIKQAQTAGIIITNEMKKEFSKLSRIEDELDGGLTFAYSSSSNNDVSCFTSPLEIFCTLSLLAAEDAITITVLATPRPLLADRTIRTVVNVFSRESENKDDILNNIDFQLRKVDRDSCFIATAAYGSYLAPEIDVLRRFRDDILLHLPLGKELVNFYYDVSPPLANTIAQNDALRTLTRWMLSPIIYTLKYPLIIMLLFICLLVLGAGRYRKKVTHY